MGCFFGRRNYGIQFSKESSRLISFFMACLFLLIIVFAYNTGIARAEDSPINLEAAEQAIAPTATPEAGTYPGPQQIELATMTEGATIFYTTDGSNPTTESTEYTGAITVEDAINPTIIKAIAAKDGLANSPAATFEYVIEFAGGAGTRDNPYLVATAQQLNNIRKGQYPNKHFKQIASFSLDSFAAGEGWEPIGIPPFAFTGTFDGDGNTISGLVIHRDRNDYAGLFGYASSGAEIRNLGLVNVNVTGEKYVGSLVSQNNGLISNCYVTGTVTSENQYVGGLVGDNRGIINNCYFDGSVSNPSSYVGGLVGGNLGEITNSHAAGTTIGQDTVGGLVGYNYKNKSGSLSGRITGSYAVSTLECPTANNVGGLVGENEGSITASYASGNVTGRWAVGGLIGDNKNSITDSYAAGKVTGINYVGGLVGDNGNEINKCFATGNVSGEDQIGGLVGSNWDDSNSRVINSFARGSVSGIDAVGGLIGFNDALSIINSYATGTVTGNSLVGGLVGYNFDDDYVITDCYYLDQTGIIWSAGGTGKTSAEMKLPATYNGWDFDNIWVIHAENDGYPYLRYMAEVDSDTIPPEWSTGFPSIINPSITETGFNLLVKTNEAGTVYFVILPDDVGSPSAGQVKNGQDHSGVDLAEGFRGFKSLFADSQESIAITGLDSDTAYDIYIVVEDSASNLQAVPVMLDVATKAIEQVAAPTANPVAGTYTSAQNVQLSTITEGATIYYTTDGSAPTTGSVPYTSAVEVAADMTIKAMAVKEGMADSTVATFAYVIESEFDGSGTPENPYLVATAQQLYNVRHHLDKHFKQIADISLSSYNAGAGWVPIGSDDDPFTGTFDGNGYKVSNLFINRFDNDYVGLFGYTDQGTEIANLGLVGIDVTTNGQAGGMIGRNKGTITNCYATGSVVGTWDSGVGGLAGENEGIVTHCYAEVTVTGDVENGVDYVGGLVGHNDGQIEDSHAAGAVTGDDYVGGLVGYAGDSSKIIRSYAMGAVEGAYDAGGLVGANDGNIEKSYAGGSVKGTERNNFWKTLAGGLAGANYGSLTDSYSIGSVSGQDRVGGLVGYNSSMITNSYALGQVTGETEYGGLAGVNNKGTISNSYWNIQTSGQAFSAGGEGKTTAEMKQKGTYDAWDLTAIWDINTRDNNGYPFLRWQEYGGPPPTSPVLSETGASAMTQTSVTLNFSSDKAGTYYYLVYAAADAAPEAAAIKAQGTALAKGTNRAMAAANAVNLIGLTAATDYKAYLIIEDEQGNVSSVATICFTTQAPQTSNDGGGSSSGGSGNTLPATPANEAIITPEQINQNLDNNQSMNYQLSQVNLDINPRALPNIDEGTITVKVAEIEDPDTLNTFFIAYPDQRGIMKGYNITFTQEHDSQTETITQLNDEITLTFELSPEEMEGIDPSTLDVYKQGDDGSVTQLDGVFNWQTGTITVSIDHLCQFFIMGKEGIPVQRLSGDNRYATAAAISSQGWQTSDNVILASGENFADALAGTTLAGIKDAPILLTVRDTLNSETLAEIQRLKPKTIYILGGTAVIAKGIEDQLAQDYSVTRISGYDRYETAVRIGEFIIDSKPSGTSITDTVVIATGSNYPDALSIASFAGQYDLPILFTGEKALNTSARQALNEWGIKKVILSGGSAVISQEVEDFLRKELHLTVTRLSGEDRYMTCLEIVKYFENYPEGNPGGTKGTEIQYKEAALATGENFPDALAGASLAAKLKMPVFLVAKDQINFGISAYLQELDLEKVYIYGGLEVITEKVEEEINN